MKKVYRTLSGVCESELLIKKSRFIGQAYPITEREDVGECLKKAKSAYPAARHYCWAYLLGNPLMASSGGMSDDGEPSGTAGKPILNVIQHKKIGDVLIVVIRYFGGIKLGAGGLVRAYSSAAEAVLSEADYVEVRPRIDVEIFCPFSQEQALRLWLQRHDAVDVTAVYGEEVRLTCSLLESDYTALEAFCGPKRDVSYQYLI